jgi:hypothetical protein
VDSKDSKHSTTAPENSLETQTSPGFTENLDNFPGPYSLAFLSLCRRLRVGPTALANLYYRLLKDPTIAPRNSLENKES